MTDAEMFVFVDAFKGLLRVFPKRLEEHEQAQMHRDYFKALRRYTVQQVQAGAEAWMQRGKYFPKPAEWIDAIPRRQPAAVEVSELSAVEAREWVDAERRGVEGEACGCVACRAAGIDKPTRFVPEFNADDTDRRAQLGQRLVTRGHWAHGVELARWYRARADFWETCHARGLTSVAKELAKAARR